ncbi:MAG TPA: dihydroorotase [Gemmatimonadaceae bacterium]|nr:dihydroorotase [Gemmatimonadaceae bacterium]
MSARESAGARDQRADGNRESERRDQGTGNRGSGVRHVVLRGGRVLDPSQNLDGVGDLVVADGKVAAFETAAGASYGDDYELIDCSGLVVAPGFIDVHCHLREPGREDVETIATGARAAAVGGFTAVCAMPNTQPVTDNQAAVGFVLRQGQAANAARVHPIGAISLGQEGKSLAEFGEMVGAGAVAVSDDGRPVASAHLMRTALEYARTFGIPVADHCEEPTLAAGGAMNEGIVSARLGLKGIPAEAEEIMVIRDILLARRTGGHVHLCHMSTKGSIELIRWGKERGIRVTAEACPHHLSLTEDAVDGYNTNAKMNPPLRTAEDVAAVRDGVRDGTIDLVATDHAPHHYDEKEREFADAPNGIVGLETALAVVNTWLVKAGIIDLATLIDRMSVSPAATFNLPGGSLRRGSVADVTVFDATREWTVDPAKFVSKGRNSPYAGYTLLGRVMCTIVGGRIVHRATG